MTLRIVTAHEVGDAFAGWRSRVQFSAIDAHPFTGGFGRGYYPLVVGETRSDRSFAVVDGDVPVVVVPCSVGHGMLDRYGLPIELFCDSRSASYAAALSLVFAHFDQMVENDHIERVCLVEYQISSVLSPIGEACLSRGWRGALALHGHCDLAEAEAGLRRHLRKSFRSLVNWGRRNMILTYLNGQNQDAKAFAAYRAFHRHIAGGGSTRPESSWTAMSDWIACGGGELTLGHLTTGELVAGTMVLDGTAVAYYSSGVYDRGRFDNPMAHFPLYDAILRAGARGMTMFDLGEIPQVGTVSAKEHAIGYFKRGFASRIASSIRWTWSQPAKSTEGGK